MIEELDILRVVAENPILSQRKIAEQAGISLGQVNFLLKKCVKKGLIKIEGQTSKSLQYNLTPKGLAEKTARTLEYVKISYGAVIALTQKITELFEQNSLEYKAIYVYGPSDEIMEICKLALHDKVHYIKEGFLANNLSDEGCVLYWDNHCVSELDKYTKRKINILD